MNLKKWKKKFGEKLILVRNSSNIGLTKSLNKGIEFCSGDYIARMDADDLSTPKRFKLQTEFFEINKEIDDRKIKMYQMHRDEALEAFKIWDNKKDKIKY